MKHTIRHKPRNRNSPLGALPQTLENNKLIQTSMERWQSLNKYGRSVGRGLSETELFDKVAEETGATKKQIHQALRKNLTAPDNDPIE